MTDFSTLNWYGWQGAGQLHYPFSSGKNAFELIDILEKAMTQLGVKLLLVDEGQESGEGHGKERPKEIANVLKRLYDKNRVAQAFLGTPTGMERFFGLGDQLATRIPTIHRLSTFDLDAEFIGVLRAYDAALPTSELSGLDTWKVASAIHDSTNGNFRLLSKLLAYAVLASARSGAPSITTEHLSAAYRHVFGTGLNQFDK